MRHRYRASFRWTVTSIIWRLGYQAIQLFTKRRRLGISTVRDRVVQASLKLVLEPIFEADFLPCSYGFRPQRRTYDAVAEVRHFTACSYEWIGGLLRLG